MLITTTKMQKIDDDDNDINKRRVDPKNYPIRLSARGGVCAKFTVVYGQSRVVCVEWLPKYIYIINKTARLSTTTTTTTTTTAAALNSHVSDPAQSPRKRVRRNRDSPQITRPASVAGFRSYVGRYLAGEIIEGGSGRSTHS